MSNVEQILVSDGEGGYRAADAEDLAELEQERKARIAGARASMPPSWAKARDKALTRCTWLQRFFADHARHFTSTQQALVAHLVMAVNGNTGQLATTADALAEQLGIAGGNVRRALAVLEGDNPKRLAILSWRRGKKGVKGESLGTIQIFIRPKRLTKQHLANLKVLRSRQPKPAMAA